MVEFIALVIYPIFMIFSSAYLSAYLSWSDIMDWHVLLLLVASIYFWALGWNWIAKIYEGVSKHILKEMSEIDGVTEFVSAYLGYLLLDWLG